MTGYLEVQSSYVILLAQGKVNEARAHETGGVYIFQISGQIHHYIGSAEPTEGEQGKFAQIYFFDYEKQTQRQNEIFPNLQPVILDTLLY